jgi:hypothetical protein
VPLANEGLSLLEIENGYAIRVRGVIGDADRF